ncbi:MAG TPA: tetratricopeptide repeat protein [Nitrososphaeraceae archaeon]
MNKGRSLSNLGKYNEAMSCFDKILVSSPKDPPYISALYFKGITFAKMGKQDEAISYYNRALDKKPDYRCYVE